MPVSVKDRQKLERGMLLLGGLLGEPGERIDSIWAVASVSQRGATLIKHSEGARVEANLKPATLPDGWVILENGPSARVLFRGD